MMDYGGGDLPLAGAAWVTGVWVQALGGDLNTAWRLSFSHEYALEVSVTQDALYKSTSYLTLHELIFYNPVLLAYQRFQQYFSVSMPIFPQ